VTRTPSQTIGPFFKGMLLEQPVIFEDGAVRLTGIVYDGAGEPVDDALVELWQTEIEAFGRCSTDASGAFHFRTRESGYADLVVFARGLLHHVRTRIYFAPKALPSIDRSETLLAHRDGEVWLFDIHLQGPDETLFFDV
jgi:protocatechuate 3,4-dioxygenase alpha subunit